MVSETFEPIRKEKKRKQQAQQSYIKKDSEAVHTQSKYKLKTQSRNGLHTAYNTD